MNKISSNIKAEELATKQRDIGVAEFFAKNRHLLGFDNKRKSLLTTIKEAVDNSLDACEEANISPEIAVEIIEMGNDRYRVIIEDNGPGIVKEQVPHIFARLLYGSKFHSLKQSRGQQGIGISASVMYGQLTTGRAAKIISKIHPDRPAYQCELKIDTAKNRAEIVSDGEREWNKDHGTKIQIDLEGSYQKGAQSVDEYLKETAVVNPHVTIIYTNPKAEQLIFPRATDQIPEPAQEIKPHPYGVELGVFMKMLEMTDSKTLQQFLTTEFSKVSPKVVKEVCEIARIQPNAKPKKLTHDDAEKLVKAIKEVKIHAPSTDCISPITAPLLEKGIKKEINAEFYSTVSRPPAVYRGNPFQIEVALAYGGDQPKDKQANVMRFANRVPLLFQQGACGVTKAIQSINWKPYGLNQSNGSLPVGPITILVHISSVWVPFTSESKEAIAHYPEILDEIRKALQEAGRELSKYTAKKAKVKTELKKRSFIQKYMTHVAIGLTELLKLNKGDEEEIMRKLEEILEHKRGQVDSMEFDPTKNTEYDAEWAKIGKESDDEDPDEEDDGLSDEPRSGKRKSEDDY
ncbi:DNA topoisomerase VI subunit B [Candidatus Woesearchaeota archaeon]|nr:DNA topoisomerase VI subunit B [Candidatus Woesearchaeota archaeon]